MSTPWDRISARVEQARRSEDQPDEQGQRALARIGELARLARLIEQETNQEVVRAREQGASWPALGRALLVTKQGAQHRYRVAVTRLTRPISDVPRTIAELEHPGVKRA